MENRLMLQSVAAAMVAAALLPSFASAEGDLSILTYPIGLVVGEHVIDVDLGSSAEPAVLYLDGETVCSVAANAPRCTVNFGEAPHVHLLELIRRDAAGRVAARAQRWVNRPGQEAELAIQLSMPETAATCQGRVLWSHPLKQDPVVLEVELGGARLPLDSDRRTFHFQGPGPAEPAILTASAIFPNGARAETVVAPQGFGGRVEADLTAAAIERTDRDDAACKAVERDLGGAAAPVADAGFEIVFVLAPGKGYRAVFNTGWNQVSVRGLPGGSARPTQFWNRAENTIWDAERLWYVLPDEQLARVNGFAYGKPKWMKTLFGFGAAEIEGPLRVADAVAASGLVVAAGPSRRAVVLVLGTEEDRDDSLFTPQQARSYLAEIGVPLHVMRLGAVRDDGWPAGTRVQAIGAFAGALVSIKEGLDRQCVAWFPGDLHPQQVAALLPDALTVAGRQDAPDSTVDAAWRRAEAVAAPTDDEGPPVGLAAAGRVEVTAVRVLIRAKDLKGQPVTDLVTGDLAVMEDGKEAPVLDLEPVGGTRVASGEASGAPTPGPDATPQAATEIPVTVYVDRELAGAAEIVPALNALAKRAGQLTAIGPVKIVVADQGIETVLEGTVDPRPVEEALHSVAGRPYRTHAIERIRTEYLRNLEGFSPGSGDTASSTPSNSVRFASMSLARRAIFEEDALLRRTLARLNDWALSAPAGGPQLLFVVGLGFDVDPIDFYQRFLMLQDPSLAAAARGEFLNYQQAARVESVGRELAAVGWLVVPVATRITGTQRRAAEFSGEDIIQESKSGELIQGVDFMMMDPLGSQRHLAEASGGKVVMGGKGLDTLAIESAGWYQLTYQVGRVPDGAFHELEISTTRPDVTVENTGVVVSGTSEGRAAMRLRELLAAPFETGELPVTVTVGEPQGNEEEDLTAEMTVTVAFDSIAPLFVEGGTRALRFSIAVLGESGEPFIHHEIENATGRLGGMHYDSSLRWSQQPVALAAVVEDLGSGAWGGAVLRLGE